MASNACFTASSAAAPVPILHCYGLEDYTMAKRYSFQLCFSRDIAWDVEEFLKNTFPWKKQIILAPYHGGNSLEPYHGGNSLAPYSGLSPSKPWKKMAYVNAAPDEKSTSAVFENLSARNSSA